MLKRSFRGRRWVRALVVEALYRQDLVGGDIQEHLREILKRENVPPSLMSFAETLTEAWRRSSTTVDALIDQHLEGWTLDELRPLERAIFRMATTELLHMDTPIPVVINEAVEITKRLCGDEPRGLINGVLDAIGKERSL